MGEIKKIKKIKHISLKVLRKKAWALQSEYIRQLEKGICFICGKHGPWRETQAAHYIHGNRMDFDVLNIHCSCVRCNKWLHGNLGVYGERMIAEFGEQAVAELRERSKLEHKFNIFELEALINKYKALLSEL